LLLHLASPVIKKQAPAYGNDLCAARLYPTPLRYNGKGRR